MQDTERLLIIRAQAATIFRLVIVAIYFSGNGFFLNRAEAILKEATPPAEMNTEFY